MILNAKPIEISLIREKVKLEDQAAKGSVLEIMNEDKPFKIGVIDIPNFYMILKDKETVMVIIKAQLKMLKKFWTH